MFFTESLPAFIKLRRMLRSGGRMDITIWVSAAENAWSSAVLDLVGHHLSLPEPVPGAPGPFALANLDRLRGLLDDSGWWHVQIDACQGDMLLGGVGSNAEQAAQFVLGSMQAGERVRQASDELKAAVMADFVQIFQSHQRSAGGVMQGKTWLVSARS